MQVDSIKPTVKAPGTKRLKLNCDAPLSNVAFNFELRRYTKAGLASAVLAGLEAGADVQALVGRCRLTLSNPH